MLQILPITQARREFLRLIEEVSSGGPGYLVTKQGRPAAVILGHGEYTRMVETLRVARDLLLQVQRGLAEVGRGELVPLEEDG